MELSVITPAHNEEDHIEKCIDSVKAAARFLKAAARFSKCEVEHIVVLNRCTDRTESIARERGCQVVTEDARILGKIRNTGVAHASGEIVVTIDADSWMTENMLAEVVRMLGTGRFIGGGVRMYPERISLGILCSVMIAAPFILWHRITSAGLFWCTKQDFDALGGFDESLVCVEDVDFAKRLKKRGRGFGKKYGTIRRASITTSCRKFDIFGDWYLVRNPKVIYDLFSRNERAADEFYYDARD